LNNSFLAERAVRDINKRVAKILKDLDDPEPPIRLEVVREQLRLDLGYYSSSDQGVLRETIHRLSVSGKQVLLRPGLLIDVVKKWDLKALWIPDRKRILIDQDLPSAKQRWGEAHEIGHSLLPWHDTTMHGDKKHTLSLACEQQIEAEANFAAGRLLFLQDRFTERLRDSALSINLIKSLGKSFGNTITSTLWMAVENSESSVFGLVSQHPKEPLCDEPIRYFIRSREFSDRFGGVTSMHLLSRLSTICRGSRGPIGKDELTLYDVNGDPHIFFVEVFYNSYDALTLGTYRSAQVLTISA
jgi:IrrE N-terminal-like domain